MTGRSRHDELRRIRRELREGEFYGLANARIKWLLDEVKARADESIRDAAEIRGLTPGRSRHDELRERQREQLRRAAEDGERLYRVRMHEGAGPTVADDNRIDGILTRELESALGFVDALLVELAAAEARAERAEAALREIAKSGPVFEEDFGGTA